MHRFWPQAQVRAGGADVPGTMVPTRPGSTLRPGPGLWAGLLLAFALWLAGPAQAAPPPLQVDDRAAVPVWPAVTLRVDPEGTLSAEQAAAQPESFAPHTGTASNLGRVDGVVWLRFALQVPGGEPVQRVLEIDYPSLNRVDVMRLQEGRIVETHRLGNQLRMAERPLRSRTHAVSLRLAPGAHEVLLRVQTHSSAVLPITLRTPEGFTEQESMELMIQGLIAGLALCLLIYSLVHALTLRDSLFLDYALLLASNMVFMLSFFGIGALYLWPEWPALSMSVAPMAVALAVASGIRFMRRTLAVAEISPRIDTLLRCACAAAWLCLLLMLSGLMNYRLAQAVTTALGLLATWSVLPAAFVRARRGERVARYMLVGWAFYTFGTLTLAGLLRAYVEPGFWTQHVYPFSTMVEMSAWMAVLGLRVQAIHRTADRARLETETQRNLAQTDALTGLPNRRGLQDRLQAALQRATPQQMLAVYLLDLDGFKPVNDRYGHDVGDALLVAVGQRLQGQLRGSDVVARLGGDEFVVLASGLADEHTALAVGQKLLAAFNTPFDAGGQVCEVGLTVGYAIAPLDGHTADELIKRADAAMYAGKQAGRRRVQRGGRSLATA
jgi:diguanylate cyclase